MDHEQAPAASSDMQGAYSAVMAYEEGEIGRRALASLLALNIGREIRVRGIAIDEQGRRCVVWDRKYGRNPRLHAID